MEDDLFDWTARSYAWEKAEWEGLCGGIFRPVKGWLLKGEKLTVGVEVGDAPGAQGVFVVWKRYGAGLGSADFQQQSTHAKLNDAIESAQGLWRTYNRAHEGRGGL